MLYNYICDTFQKNISLADKLVHPAILRGIKTLTFTAYPEAIGSFASWKHSKRKNKTCQLNQSECESCPRSVQKLPGSFPDIYKQE